MTSIVQDPELQTLTIKDLAKILNKSEKTIKNDVSRAPERLPPRLRIPGSDRVLWRAKTVCEWLEKHEEPTDGHKQNESDGN